MAMLLVSGTVVFGVMPALCSEVALGRSWHISPLQPALHWHRWQLVSPSGYDSFFMVRLPLPQRFLVSSHCVAWNVLKFWLFVAALLISTWAKMVEARTIPGGTPAFVCDQPVLVEHILQRLKDLAHMLFDTRAASKLDLLLHA